MTHPRVSHCRSCSSPDLVLALDFGEQYVSDFVPPGRETAGLRLPTDMVLCRKCDLLQLATTPPGDLLYRRHYWYRSGVTETMRQALRDVVVAATEIASPNGGDVVLDIGANDGTLLSHYPANFRRVGVEPADNLISQLRERCSVVINGFWNHGDYFSLGLAPAKIVTACGMLYDLADPNPFVRDVALSLAPDGLFVSQLMCLQNMFDLADVGNFAHEHVEHYSLRSLHLLFSRNGLTIRGLSTNDVNGRSYRLYATRTGSTLPIPEELVTNLAAAEYRERMSRFGEAGTYADFYGRLASNRQRCLDYLSQEKAAGRSTWVYGASTKGNTILQWYGIDKDLVVAAADKSPEKHGKVTVGSGIPITSEEEMRAARPDNLLILPYAFLREFMTREADLRSRGCKFVVPIPNFRVV